MFTFTYCTAGHDAVRLCFMVTLRTSSFSDVSKLRDKPDATGWPHNFCSILSKSDVAKKGERAGGGGRVKVKTRKQFFI